MLQVMGSEYWVALEKANLDAMEVKIQEVTMIYKGIEWLCGDPTPLWKKLENYSCAISAYLSLKKAASLCCYSTIVGQPKAACTEQVELPQSHYSMVRTNLDSLQERHRSVIQKIADLEETIHLTQEEECQLKRDVEAKSFEL